MALGEATKLVSLLTDASKEYIFKVRFGARTDSGDYTGRPVGTTDHIPSEEDCRRACFGFIGKITQIPPAFSALKINGKRAYSLAREGVSFEIKPREVEIYSLALLNFDPGLSEASFKVECSKGTYVRTLAEDLAFSLQSLCFVLELARTRVGCFSAADGIYLSEASELGEKEAAECLTQKLIGIGEVLKPFLSVEVGAAEEKKIRHGQKVRFDSVPDAVFCWIQSGGRPVAIGKIEEGFFISSRVLNL